MGAIVAAFAARAADRSARLRRSSSPGFQHALEVAAIIAFAAALIAIATIRQYRHEPEAVEAPHERADDRTRRGGRR